MFKLMKLLYKQFKKDIQDGKLVLKMSPQDHLPIDKMVPPDNETRRVEITHKFDSRYKRNNPRKFR